MAVRPQHLEFLQTIQKNLHYFSRFDGVVFKTRQMQALESLFLGKDLFVNLPTGYGKSLIYQLGMKVVASVRNVEHPVCLVVSPLNSLIDDQASKLIMMGFRVGLIAQTDRKPGFLAHPEDDTNSSESDSDLDDPAPAPTRQINNTEMINSGKLDFLFSHPEAILSRDLGRKLLKKRVYQDSVVLVAIDEAHCVVEWGARFRRDYSKLSALSAILRSPLKTAMTATAPPSYQDIIVDSLCLREPTLITALPDRPNIKYRIVYSAETGEVRARSILEPMAEALKEQRFAYPQTVVYMQLRLCGYAYKLFNSILADEQYEPIGAEPVAANRLFCQFHGAYPVEMNTRSLKAFVSDQVCRVIFASPSFGMGIDAPEIRSVIHIGVPRSVEEYFQETGRCGRDGKSANCTMYYNGHDISSNRTDLKDSVRKLCKLKSCIRVFLMDHFGFKVSAETLGHGQAEDTCCSVCDCENLTEESST